ncbi:MAG: hypothetical protein QXU32_02225 [Nitrososphaerales archaeon]
MSVIRFGITVFGETREEVMDELEQHSRNILYSVGGEPWLLFEDHIERIPIVKSILNADQSKFVYVGKQEYVFTGPTPLGDTPVWRDGFRPQQNHDF